jgi:hypothetical protein
LIKLPAYTAIALSHRSLTSLTIFTVTNMLSTILVAAALVGTAAAHGGVTSYKIAGTTYPGWQAFNSASGQTSIERPYSSYNP